MMNNLHILQLPSWYSTNSLPRGGKFVLNQAQILQEKGFTVRILANAAVSLSVDKCDYFSYPFSAFVCEESGITHLRHYFRNFPKMPQTNARRWTKTVLALFEKYQKQFGTPDVIHAHSVLYGGYAAALIKERYGIPYIITEHRGVFGQSCEYARNVFTDWETPYFEKAFSDADCIVPVSENLTAKIHTFLKNEVPIIPVSNVLDTDFFHYKRREVAEKIRFITTGTFNIAKAYDILLPAFDCACSENPNLELWIMGGGFLGDEPFEAIWCKIKNKNNFRFLGSQNTENVRDNLYQADVYISASRVEAQPVAVLEALSTGLPIVCTTVVPKVVATPENSIVVPVEDVMAMTDAILKMSRNYQKYDGKAISEYIKTVCGKEVFIEAMIRIYNDVLDNKNESSRKREI